MEIKYVKSSHSEAEKKASHELITQSFDDTSIANDDYYNWQYLENPVGVGTVLLAYDDIHPSAQYVAIPCKFQFNNKIFLITLTMNICVSPKYRGKGLSTKVIEKIHDLIETVPFSIVLPNNDSMKAHLNNKYKAIKMQFLIRPVKFSYYFQNIIIRTILKPFNIFWKKKCKLKLQEYSKEFDNKFDYFEKNTRRKNTFRQVRDSSFLNWRYRKNPKRSYKVFVASDDNNDIEGYIITRTTELNGKRIGFIMDFVAKKKSYKIKNLVNNALEDFWQNDVTITTVSCFPEGIEYEILREEGFYICPEFLRPHPLKILIKIFNESTFTKQILLDPTKWFFMPGDYETF